jgi:hypothetical protein
MDCNRKWKVESKEFEVLIKGGATGVRIIERSHDKRRSIFVQRNELTWLVRTVEDVVEKETSEVFWDQSRATYLRIIVQKRSNRHGQFLTIEEFDGRRRVGAVLILEGWYGQGWTRLISELSQAKASLWEGREARVGKVARDGKEVKKRPFGKVEQALSAIQTRQVVARDSGYREKVLSKARGQVGCALGFGVSGDEVCGAAVKDRGQSEKMPPKVDSGESGGDLCGGDGAVGGQGGANPKGRWIQALLSPAPYSMDEACVAFPGKTVLREEGVSDKGVSVFNAKVELYNCREWLRKIRGEVDAGLQKLDRVLRGVDFSGPGQGNMGLEWVPKPKKTPEPRGKNFFIPKVPRVGSGLDLAGCKYKAQTESLNSSGAGSSGQSRGPLGGFCDKAMSSVLGLGPATGRAGILGGDSSKPKSVGSPARSSSSRSGEPGSVPISGSVPFSEKVASTEYSSMKVGLGKPGSMPISGSVPILEKVASTEYSSSRGVAEPIQLSPVQEEKEGSMLAMEERDLCVERLR